MNKERNNIVLELDISYDDEGLPKLEAYDVLTKEEIRPSDAKQISDFIDERYRLSSKTEEYVYLLAFGPKNRLIGVFEVNHGTVEYAITNVRDILKRVLMCGGVEYVIVHNHPSGDTKPSIADRALAEKLMMASDIVGVKCKDSIIIGNGEYYSFLENDKMEIGTLQKEYGNGEIEIDEDEEEEEEDEE